ncbi:hypothetical protein [Radiobacillus sp. PE A8.2]|uniref:hypothetical protein n=1 Tax=Radiobacillus sp. PE A8.2 TaxID=3380349 RepID=UPI0038903106
MEHIQRHEITPQEAEEVFYDPNRCKHNAYGGRVKIIGVTEDGRILAIVYEKSKKRFRPFTGWDATSNEKKSYNKRWRY